VRKQGERIPEPRVLVKAAPLIKKAKQALGGGYEELAKSLEISKTTLLDYKSGRALMPVSIYNLLKRVVGEDPGCPETLPPYWGQRKGGLKAGRKTRLSKSQARLMAHKSHLSRRIKREKMISMLTKKLQESKPVLLAEFVGRMLGDGSISTFPKYFSSEYESHARMRLLIKELFNYDPKTVKREKYYETRLRRISVQVLNKLNIPIGKKSLTNPHVPEFIIKSENKEVISALIRGYFDDEAYVSKSRIEVSSAVRLRDEELRGIFGNKRSVSIRLVNEVVKGFKPPRSNLLEDIRFLLHKLGINADLKCVRVLFGKTSLSVEWKLIIIRDDFHKALENNLILPWKLKRLKP